MSIGCLQIEHDARDRRLVLKLAHADGEDVFLLHFDSILRQSPIGEFGRSITMRAGGKSRVWISGTTGALDKISIAGTPFS